MAGWVQYLAQYSWPTTVLTKSPHTLLNKYFSIYYKSFGHLQRLNDCPTSLTKFITLFWQSKLQQQFFFIIYIYHILHLHHITYIKKLSICPTGLTSNTAFIPYIYVCKDYLRLIWCTKLVEFYFHLHLRHILKERRRGGKCWNLSLCTCFLLDYFIPPPLLHTLRTLLMLCFFSLSHYPPSQTMGFLRHLCAYAVGG